MTCRTYAENGVVYSHRKRGIIMLDEADYQKIRAKGGYLGVATNNDGRQYAFVNYHREVLKKKTTYRKWLHREIMDPEPGQVVDHRDHNGLDNRRNNLRVCTYSQNKQNGKRYKNSKGKYKGVTQGTSGLFSAKIQFRGKSQFLGCYPTEEMAAAAYDAAAKDFFGEFACLNLE